MISIHVVLNYWDLNYSNPCNIGINKTTHFKYSSSIIWISIITRLKMLAYRPAILSQLPSLYNLEVFVTETVLAKLEDGQTPKNVDRKNWITDINVNSY